MISSIAPRAIPLLLLLAAPLAAAAQDLRAYTPTDSAAARAEADGWLARVDAGDWAGALGRGASFLGDVAGSPEGFGQFVTAVRGRYPIGPGRRVIAWQPHYVTRGAPSGEYARLTYTSDSGTREHVVVVRTPAGWRVAMYMLESAPAPAPADDAPRAALDVRFVTDEPEAVLAILDARAAGAVPTDDMWRRLFASEGYRRLQAREASLGRAFSDSSFRAFVLQDSLLARRDALRRTLAAWTASPPAAAARRALRYLPASTVIRARVYPSIKPRENSFVFETTTDPAIFLFLDPAVNAAQAENTMAHELHHIGIAAACADAEPADSLSAGVATALDWMGGFAEGVAMLAASDGPGADPHATSGAAERSVWLRHLGFAQRDVGRLEAFFVDLMEERVAGDEATRRGFEFVATDDVPQGAFYTVGWLMVATVERELGRDQLVSLLCSPHRLILAYDASVRRAAARGIDFLPRWSPAFVARLRGL